MNNIPRTLFHNMPSSSLTASTLFSSFCPDGSTYQVNLPYTDSLMNYIPSSRGGSFHGDPVNGASEEELSEELPENINFHSENEDERCQELWRTYRDSAGPWISHRFTITEWDISKPDFDETGHGETTLGGFDGVLTKELIAPNLSRLDRCPEFHYYAYTKCVLFKKKLTNIDALKTYQYLQYVDLSFNKLVTLKPLGNLPFLKILDASHNMLTTILDFKAPFFLTVVDLSHNKIRVMTDLSDFWSITDLNLAHNQITVINGIRGLRYLYTLNLSFNGIEIIENLDSLRIQFLYLQNNAIRSFDDGDSVSLHTLKNLRTINLNYNQISSLKMFEAAENLECLDIANNNVSQLLDIYCLKNLKYLNKLNLTNNPVTFVKRYIEICITYIKNLVWLDGEQINSDFWFDKLISETTDVSQIAARNRLQLLVLEQLNPPQVWNWLLPYDYPPIAVIVMIGLQASRRAYIVKKFCADKTNVVVGTPYTTCRRHANNVDGEHFHYVDEETFMSMLKNGEFLTYQENLGTYCGIPHSEFKEAENGILLFYTNLAMALALKREFLNTVFVLSLPSTTEAHVEILTSLYDIQVIDDDTLKCLNTCALAAECRPVELLNSDVRAIVDKLVEDVSRMFDEADVSSTEEEDPSSNLEISSPASSTRSSANTSNKSDKSEILQLWWASTPINTLSMLIQPANLSSTLFMGAKDIPDLSEQSKANLESVQNTAQMKRYVSFTVSQVHTINDSATPLDQKSRDAFRVSAASARKVGNQTRFDNNEKSNLEEPPTSVNTSKEPDNPINSKAGNNSGKSNKVPKENRHYTNTKSRDDRIKSCIDEELYQREELLELHLQMPGLFREILFTDQEDESIDKLRVLVKDITKYNKNTKQVIMSFENDQKFSRIVNEKISRCFREVRKEMSTSEKQAGKYTLTSSYSHNCEGTVCENPNCQPW